MDVDLMEETPDKVALQRLGNKVKENTVFSRSTDPATYDFKYLPSEISGPE
jgi:hypothetical protein